MRKGTKVRLHRRSNKNGSWKAGRKQYELTTTDNSLDMPFQVYGRNRKSVLKSVKRKLRKGERVISLRRVYW